MVEAGKATILHIQDLNPEKQHASDIPRAAAPAVLSPPVSLNQASSQELRR